MRVKGDQPFPAVRDGGRRSSPGLWYYGMSNQSKGSLVTRNKSKASAASPLQGAHAEFEHPEGTRPSAREPSPILCRIAAGASARLCWTDRETVGVRVKL